MRFNFGQKFIYELTRFVRRKEMKSENFLTIVILIEFGCIDDKLIWCVLNKFLFADVLKGLKLDSFPKRLFLAILLIWIRYPPIL